ncbi:MAG: CHAT domain-containing protein [Bacteroidetes bacterium]|nr:MAG: CHAT domain-containing protein [Bacteroidota bacterium]
MATHTPVFLLAFANDRAGSFLRSIAAENRQISEILRKLEEENYCELIVLPDANIRDILRVFREKRNRVRLFHYGGHADDYGLLLNSAKGQEEMLDAGSFARFLGMQNKLKFVFLNGCSTLEQSRQLANAGVGYVIATNQQINDRTAQEFSRQFYESMANGFGVEAAFQEASAGVQAATGGNTRALLFEPEASPADENGKLPWELHAGPSADPAWHLKLLESDVVAERAINLVGANRLEKAVKTLATHFKETEDRERFGELKVINRQLKDVDRKSRIGVLSDSESVQMYQRIADSLIQLANSMRSARGGGAQDEWEL